MSRGGKLALALGAWTLFGGGVARAQISGVDIRTGELIDKRRAESGERALKNEPGAVVVGSFILKPTGDGGYTYEGAQFKARIAHDGTVDFSRPWPFIQDGPEPHIIGRDPLVSPNLDDVNEEHNVINDQVIESLPGVRFDITEEYMRLRGQDPARAEKANFLTATFDLRMHMATVAGDENASAALTELPARLEALWGDPRYTPLEKRRLLRAMWDELGNDASADRARVIMRTFANTHLPPAEAAYYD